MVKFAYHLLSSGCLLCCCVQLISRLVSTKKFQNVEEELIVIMATYSREYKNAVRRNTAFQGNLQNSLEDIESQKKRFMRSLRDKKLNFIESRAALPKLFSSPDQIERKEHKHPVVTRQLSLDSSELNGPCEWRLTTKKRLSFPNDMVNLPRENHQLTKVVPEQNNNTLQVSIGSGTQPRSPITERRRHSENLSTETPKTPLAPTLSLPSELSTWEEEQDAFGSDPEVGIFKTRLRVPTPYATLGTQLPLSPLLQKKNSRPSKGQLSPLDIAGEKQSISLPASPRFQRRRRAESWDQAESQDRSLDVFAKLARAGQKLRSMSLGCEELKRSKEVSSLVI